MTRIRLLLEYDGTDFVGLQLQPNGRSVQGVLERALELLLGVPTRVGAAGRTDAGVHARGQVVTFDTERKLPLSAYTRGLNGLLPPDVAVRHADEVPTTFDVRRDACGKRYIYAISNFRQRSPLRRRTHWELFAPLDVGAMQTASRCLLGEHDFSAFRAADCEAERTRREVVRLDVLAEPPSSDTVTVVVEGRAFLKHMVRNIVGTLVEVGRQRRPVDWVADVLASRDRTQAGPTAPPQGLVLENVFYTRPW
ncbi:MAG: tRNA pseudouridine(38-40) synthase TruA [Myxococcaceae bacterium]